MFELIEMHLEKFLMDGDSILMKVQLLNDLMENEESVFKLQLNYTQNEILLLNTTLTILSCAIGFGGFITGGFGMNLDNTQHLQNVNNSFLIVFTLALAAIIGCFLSAYNFFKWSGILPEIVGKKRRKNEKSIKNK